MYHSSRIPRTLVALSCLTGSGESAFINTLMGEYVALVGHRLNTETKHIQHFTRPDPDLPGCRIVVVDTPSFDDTFMDEWEVLRCVAVWLARSHDVNMKLAGLVYLQDITQTGNFGAINRYVDVAMKLCGKPAR